MTPNKKSCVAAVLMATLVLECANASPKKGHASARGAIPAVGGYSNYSTVGIVTEVEGGSFGIQAGKAASEPIAVGKGVLLGDKLWVEQGAVLRITDTYGGRITIAGPAALDFGHKGRVRVEHGSVKFKSVEAHALRFEAGLAQGVVDGEAVVWASKDLTQVLGLAGDVKAWHSRLSEAVVPVTPGYFTECSTAFKHLHLKKPERVDADRFQAFLSRFDAQVPQLPKEEAWPKRAIATEEKAAARGSRHPQEVLEPKNSEVMERLKAHLTGKNYDDLEEAPLASAGQKLDAYGRPIERPSRGVSSAAAAHRPGFEVVGRAKKLDVEQKQLLDRLTKRRQEE